MGREPLKPLQEKPPPDFQAESRLPTQPWMKWGGASLLAAIIVWFRSPKRNRSQVLRPAIYAVLMFAAVVAAIFATYWFIRFMDWALHG